MNALTTRRLWTASLMNGGGFIVASLVTVGWYFLLLRNYSAAGSGQLLLAMSVAGLINLLDLGVSSGLIRSLSSPGGPDNPPARDHFWAAVMITGAPQLVAGTAAVLCWRQYYDPGIPILSCVCIVAFALSTQIVMMCSSALKGLCDFRIANFISTGTTLTVYGVGAFLLSTGHDLWDIFVIMTMTQVACASVASVGTYLRVPGANATSPLLSGLLFARLLRTSLPFFPQLFTGIFFMHAQRFFIARYAGIESVAMITFAYSLATRIHSIINAFSEVIFPMTQRLRESGTRALSFSLRLGALTSAVYLVAAAIVVVISAILMPSIVLTLIVFCVGVMFATAAVPAFHLLNGSGASAQVSICSVLSPLIFIIVVMSIHGLTGSRSPLLLPISYMLAMFAMLPQVFMLVKTHAKKFDRAEMNLLAATADKGSR